MTDLTLIYYTSNRVDDSFADKIRHSLASFGLPIISVSQKPLDFGYNISIGDIGASIYNIYKQVLVGAKEAKTKYVACCEDDALYNEEHFQHRPTDGAFAYNLNRWNANHDLFFWRRKANMSMCIASTELMVDTLEKRFEKFPNPLSREKGELIGFGEPGRFEEHLGLPVVGIDKFKSLTPTIVFNHRPSVGGVRIIHRRDKIRRELPYWGKATELWEQYWNE